MSKALYRTFRPQTFDEVLDQDPITTVLKNQVKTGNIGHAYIFSGGRGTGKTSCAKIFARAVNCLHPVDGNPCNACENCLSILNETTMDVVEMDAASNRRIDDIRELRDKVIYPPAKLRYKVYIIDEAHMITNEAFNALLKIMEEPPAHLIFILATTELDKVPQTILSRTQRYEFTRIGLPAIEQEIQMIAGRMDLEIEPEAGHALALAADGAMRDALSLLDQVLASGERPITEASVNRVLGSVGQNAVARLTRYILENDSQGALTCSEELYQAGKDAHSLMHELILYFRVLLLVKGGVETRRLDLNPEELADMENLAAMTSLGRLVDSLEILIQAEVDMRKADYADAFFQATLVRLVNYVNYKDMLSRLEAVESKLDMVERWQDPETVSRRTLERLLAQGTLLQAPGVMSGPAAGNEPAAGSEPEGPFEAEMMGPEDFEPADYPEPEQDDWTEPIYPTDLDDLAAGEPLAESEAAMDPADHAEPKPLAEEEPLAGPETATDSMSLKDLADLAKSVEQEEAEEPEIQGDPAFVRDPASWVEANSGKIRKAVAKEKKINPFFLGKYQAVDLIGRKVYVTYEKRSPSLLMMEKNQASLESILRQLTGGDYQLVLGDERPKRPAKADQAPANPAQQPVKADQAQADPALKPAKKKPVAKTKPAKAASAPADPAPAEGPAEAADPILQKLKEWVPEDKLEIGPLVKDDEGEE